MRILALDLSSVCTGGAVGDATAPPHTFSAAFMGATRGARGHKFAIWMRAMLADHQPALVAYEMPLKMTRRRAADGSAVASSTKAGEMLQMMGFLVEVVCAGRGVRCVPIAVQSWRKDFLGAVPKGQPAAEIKRQVVRMCDRLGWAHGSVTDRAEACGVWASAHLRHGDAAAMHRLLSGSSLRRMGDAR